MNRKRKHEETQWEGGLQKNIKKEHFQDTKYNAECIKSAIESIDKIEELTNRINAIQERQDKINAFEQEQEPTTKEMEWRKFFKSLAGNLKGLLLKGSPQEGNP